MDLEMYDCVVVGAGAAGLSAALVLGRARVKTLVVDAGRQSNLASTGIGGLLGADQSPPAAFYAAARAEVGSTRRSRSATAWSPAAPAARTACSR
jgi:thioredoxin reductase